MVLFRYLKLVGKMTFFLVVAHFFFFFFLSYFLGSQTGTTPTTPTSTTPTGTPTTGTTPTTTTPTGGTTIGNTSPGLGISPTGGTTFDGSGDVALSPGSYLFLYSALTFLWFSGFLLRN